jgi:hypothetical protein
MVIDHMGYIFFPDVIYWRLVGRLSMPFFAYGIARGYRYSHEKGTERKYLRNLVLFAVLSQMPYYLMAREGTNIGFTWTFSLLLLIILSRTDLNRPRAALKCLVLLCIAYLIDVDYGVYGVLMPFALCPQYKYHKMFLYTIILWALYILMNGVGGLIQVLACLCVPLLAVIEPIDGKIRLPRRFFYVFYPTHILILLAINHIM